METTTSNPASSSGHPPGLYVLFFTEMWERFSYYGMRAILILFLLDKVRGGMGLSESESGAIYGLYVSSVYLLSLPGGWLADNILGQRKAIWYGGITIMLGHIVLAIPAGQGIFFSGLALVALGTGLLKPNISSIVSELYPEGGARRDAAFSIFYMGINMGSFLGQFVVSYLGEKVSWHTGFGAAAIAMFLGLVAYRTLGPKYLQDKGMYPKAKEKVATENQPPSNQKLSLALIVITIAFIAFLSFTGTINLSTATGIAQAMGIIIPAITVIYFVNILVAGGLTTVEKKRVGVLMIFFLGAALFWSGFEQAGSSLTIFADRYTQRDLGGWVIPAGWFQNFNPAYILIFAAPLASLWIFLAKRNLNPATPIKFGIGIILMGLGFLIMVFAANVVVGSLPEVAKVSGGYLIFTYMLHTLGELCLSPVGLSVYTKLAPKQYLSQLMGIWFVAASFGNLIAGLFAGGFDAENVQQMPDLFMNVVKFALITGVLFIVLAKPIKKWMGGIE
ncbi:peptide MFS transporter [Tellurirhabdus bombi]|uniref:peptide MFS transporter n=1 Tax=Tellurirhabdus bombi TaxID=2907205 RepID=UPI001F2AF876|nr:peptide MFS transporter [Tellurirhabdus bombi]